MYLSIWQGAVGQFCTGRCRTGRCRTGRCCAGRRVDKSDVVQFRWKSMLLFFSIVLVLLVVRQGSAQDSKAARDAVGSLHQGKQGTVDGEARPLVLAHYMPWYEAKPLSQTWGWHWTMNHFDPDRIEGGRRSIASNYYPLIGPYDSGDPDVLECHLLMMKIAGIDGVIVDWYGLTDYRDYALLHRNTTRLLQQCEKLQMRFVICYEDQTLPALVKAERLKESSMVQHAAEEINWLSRYWFNSGSYVRIQNRPVLLSFGHDGLTPQQWSQCLKKLEKPVAYYSQDTMRPGGVGGFNWPSPHQGLAQYERFLNMAPHWPSFIPAAFPRFDDVYKQAGVGDGFPKIPDRSGEILRDTLRRCKDPKAPIIQIATWNDWGEGTQVEPSIEHGFRDLEYIQSFVQKELSVRSGFSASDLRLPTEILKLKRSGRPVSPEALRKSAVSIIHGDTTVARAMLEQYQ